MKNATSTTDRPAPITNKDRSRAAQIANALHWQKGYTLSEAWKKAWKVVRIKKALAAGIIQFTYTKKDGTTRQATGTTRQDITNYKPTGTARSYSPLYVRYYDLEKQAFRQFAAERV